MGPCLPPCLEQSLVFLHPTGGGGTSEESDSILLPSAHGSAEITEFSISVDSGDCISSFLGASAYTTEPSLFVIIPSALQALVSTFCIAWTFVFSLLSNTHAPPSSLGKEI